MGDEDVFLLPTATCILPFLLASQHCFLQFLVKSIICVYIIIAMYFFLVLHLFSFIFLCWRGFVGSSCLGGFIYSVFEKLFINSHNHLMTPQHISFLWLRGGFSCLGLRSSRFLSTFSSFYYSLVWVESFLRKGV